jgi:hypothetical protein
MGRAVFLGGGVVELIVGEKFGQQSSRRGTRVLADGAGEPSQPNNRDPVEVDDDRFFLAHGEIR